MTDVTLTAALRSNLLTLQGHQKTLDQTQLRLATGKKVNSALDNANSFYTSSALNFRASDLSNLLDGMSQSIQILKAADHAITALSQYTQQAAAIVQEADELLAGGNVYSYISGDIPAGIVLPLFGNLLIQTPTYTIGPLLNGDTLADLAYEINYTFSASGFVAAVIPGSGIPATERLAIIATDGRPVSIFNNAIGNYFSTNHAVSGGSVAQDNNGNNYVTGSFIQPSQKALELFAIERRYTELRQQISALTKDSSYRGVNLLNGDTLKTPFNESNSSSQTVSGVTLNATRLGLTRIHFADATHTAEALAQIKNAQNTLRLQAKTFGQSMTILQTRTDYTQTLINHLKEGADQLTLADKNAEGANLLSTQTAQQMSITALSLASQAAQAVLRLFG